MSIRRRIQLVLDAATARRVERDTKRALDRGTDARKPKANLTKIGRAVSTLKSKVGQLGASLLAMFAVQKVVAFTRAVLEGFGRQERAILRVNSALMNMGQFTEENSKILQENAAALQRVTATGDEAILEATATIADLATELTVGELAKAQEAAIALADTFFEGNLTSAANLLAKSIGSSTNALSRYGVEIDTAGTQSQKLDDVLSLTNTLFLTSKRAATDLTGRTAQLSNSWGDLHEAIGRIIARGLGLTDRLVIVREKVDEMTESLEKNQNTIAGWGQVIIKVVGAAFESVRFVIRALFNFGQIIGSGFELAMLVVQRIVAPTLNRIVDLLDKIPGINIPFRMNELTPEEFWAENRRLSGQISRDTDDLKDTVLDLAAAYTAVATTTLAAARGQIQVSKGGIVDPGGGGGDSRFAGLLTGPFLPDPTVIADQSAQILETYTALVTGMRSTLDRANPFGEMIDQAKTTADFMRNGFRGVGESIVSQLIAGRAQEQFAAGLAALAAGTWPPNPVAIAAAGRHFVAAAAFRALASSASFGGGGGGAAIGGGGFGGVPRGGIGTSGPTAAAMIAPEVNIFIDPLSPADARFQRVVLGATENARERFGPNVKVNVRPRTGS